MCLQRSILKWLLLIGIGHDIEEFMAGYGCALGAMMMRRNAHLRDFVHWDVVRVAEEAIQLRLHELLARHESMKLCGHGCVGVQQRLGLAGIAKVGRAAIGRVEGHAEVPVDDRIVNCLAGLQCRAERCAMQMRRRRTEPVEQRRHQVGCLRQDGDPRAGTLRARQMDDQWNAGDLVIDRHAVLHPVLVLAEHAAMIGGQDDNRILPGIELVELVPESAEPVVGHRQQGGVAITDMRDRRRAVGAHTVIRPVVEGAVPGVAVELQILGHDIEGFVRIEQLELQQPMIARPIVVKPTQRMVDTTRSGEFMLFTLRQAVEGVLLARVRGSGLGGAQAGRRS